MIREPAPHDVPPSTCSLAEGGSGISPEVIWGEFQKSPALEPADAVPQIPTSSTPPARPNTDVSYELSQRLRRTVPPAATYLVEALPLRGAKRVQTTILMQGADHLLTETELSGRINVAVATLRRWRWSGDGPPFVRVGRCVRYDPAHVQAWLDSQTRRSTSDPGPGLGVRK